MILLALKIVLAPALVAAASLAGRRFGPRVGGWLIGFPVVGGPVLGFMARDEGAPFAARAAAGTVLGTLALCLFLLVYVWSAQRRGWLASTLLGWVAFVAGTLAVAHTPVLVALGLLGRLLLAFGALALTMIALPQPTAIAARGPAGGDLPWRMIATAALVVALTGLARALGPTLSGLFTPFPVATTVLVVFAHREGGAPAVRAVYAGFIPSLFSFAAFCAALSFGLARWQPWPAFVAALAVSLLSQTLVLELVRRGARAE